MANIEIKQFEKKFKESVISLGKDLVNADKDIINVSPAIDFILGGGIPVGSIVLLSGNPKVGKTVTALTFLRNAQKKGYPIYYIDIECRLKKRDLNGISGLDSENIYIVRSNKGAILTAEDYLDVSERILHDKPGAVVVMDSISHIVTTAELTSDIGNRDRAPGAVLLSKWLKRIRPVVTVNDCIVICIVHFISNVSGYGKTTVKSGGKKIQYASDIDLECTKTSPISNSSGQQVGQISEWKAVTTALCPPGRTCESYIKYGYGIDDVAELINMCAEFGIIDKSGGWFTVNDKKYHGRDALVEALLNDDSLYNELRSKYYSMV